MIWSILQRIFIAGLVSLTQLLFTSNTAAQELRERQPETAVAQFITSYEPEILSMDEIISAIDNYKIIYGTDDRYESLQYQNKDIAYASYAVAGRINKKLFIHDDNDPDNLKFIYKSAERAYGLCEEVRFSKQPVLPKCSGFLVAPDILVTAGHCVASEYDCEKFSWNFDFYDGVEYLTKDNSYNCKKIIAQKWEDKKYKLQDYAVIQLDRFATNHPHLKIRSKGRAKVGTKLVTIGHPSGLPKKTTDNAEVMNFNRNELMYTMLQMIGVNLKVPSPIRSALRKRYYFVANFDTFAGNSGSPVINEKTLEVEGILVEGGTDYVYDEEFFCNKENVVKDNAWTAEERVFRITKIPNLKEIINDSYFRLNQKLDSKE